MIDAFEFVMRSSAVLAVGLIASWLLRRQPASLRHWLIAAALALGATQPLINLMVPAIELPAIEWAGETIPIVYPPAGSTVTHQVSATTAAGPGIDWRRLMLYAWAGGAAASLAVLALGAVWLTLLGARATDASARWQEAGAELQGRLGIRRHVRIAVTQHPALLVTWGTIRPVILLPAGADAWPADRIRLVLAHELAHLVRHDWLVQLLSESARALNWFNPLFWIASARLRRESELACDDMVLALGIGGTSYASHLIDLARTFSVHGRTWLPAPSIARPSTLERRVRAMLNPQENRRPVSKVRRAALAVLLASIALPIAAASLASQSSSTPSGTVVDPSGRPLADAGVRLTSITTTEQSFETRTDANGAFSFAPVPPGDYMLSVRAPGFSGGRQRLQLRPGEFTLTMKAQVGTLQETVTVVGGPGQGPDAARTEQSVTMPAAPTCAPSAAGQIEPPMKIRDVRPRYKQAWAGSNLQGSVLLQARIGVDGRVRSVDSLSRGEAELEDEAIAAVSQWQFSPTYLNCEPIEVQMYVTVSFRTQ